MSAPPPIFPIPTGSNSATVTGYTKAQANARFLTQVAAAQTYYDYGSDATLASLTVGTGGAASASASINLTGTNKALLLNRCTTAQMNAITSPEDGMLLYNTEESALYVYEANSGTWSRISDTTSTLFPDGSVSAPSIAFTNATGSGFWLSSSGVVQTIATSINGNNVFEWHESYINPKVQVRGINFGESSASLPTYSFTGDSTCGMFHAAASSIGFSTNSVARLTIGNSSLTATVPILVPDGSVGAPSLCFDSDTGFWRDLTGVGSVRLSEDGAEIARFQNNFLQVPAIRAQIGSISECAFNFGSSDTAGVADSGMYLQTTPDNRIFIARGGSRCVSFTNNSVDLYSNNALQFGAGDVSTPTVKLNGQTTGLFSTGAANLSVTSSGTAVAAFDATGISTPIAGSAANCALSLRAVDYGLFSSGASAIGLSCDGTAILTATTTATTIPTDVDFQVAGVNSGKGSFGRPSINWPAMSGGIGNGFGILADTTGVSKMQFTIANGLSAFDIAQGYVQSAYKIVAPTGVIGTVGIGHTFNSLESAAGMYYNSGLGLRQNSTDVLFATSANLNVGSARSVSIGSGSNAAASAVLDVTSTTQGILPPRMTTAQKNAISSPATGLVVFDSTLGALCVYSGGWSTLSITPTVSYKYPAASTSYATSTTGSLVDISNATFDTTVTAPASGAFRVNFSGGSVSTSTSGGNYYQFYVVETAAASTPLLRWISTIRNTNESTGFNHSSPVTGYTPGNSYTFRLRQTAFSSGTQTITTGTNNDSNNSCCMFTVQPI